MADINLASHQYSNQVITQTIEDTVINGVLIPKGYVNATEMCKANGKRWAKYLEYSKTQPFLDELSKITQSPSQGRSFYTINSGSTEFIGTWVSFPVAMNLAQWCSPEFAAWAAITLTLIIKGDFQALTSEALEAERQLNLIWDKVRRSGIDNGRLPLTDAIKDWYQRNPGKTSRPIHAMYAVTTNAIYQKLWNVEAKTLEALLGCSRNESRDYLDSNSLRILERAEARVAEFIDDDNIKPIDAVEAANIKKAKSLPIKKEN